MNFYEDSFDPRPKIKEYQNRHYNRGSSFDPLTPQELNTLNSLKTHRNVYDAWCLVKELEYSKAELERVDQEKQKKENGVFEYEKLTPEYFRANRYKEGANKECSVLFEIYIGVYADNGYSHTEKVICTKNFDLGEEYYSCEGVLSRYTQTYNVFFTSPYIARAHVLSLIKNSGYDARSHDAYPSLIESDLARQNNETLATAWAFTKQARPENINL